MSHESAIRVLCNYRQQLQKPGAEFRGFTTAMTLMCRFETKDATERGDGQHAHTLHRTRLDKRLQ